MHAFAGIALIHSLMIPTAAAWGSLLPEAGMRIFGTSELTRQSNTDSSAFPGTTSNLSSQVAPPAEVGILQTPQCVGLPVSGSVSG